MTRLTSQISPTVTKTLFKVGAYAPLTDTFTSLLDLNDQTNYWLVDYSMPQPKKVDARASNIRTPGEQVVAVQYQNRHITVTLQLLFAASTSDLTNRIRTLLNAIEHPPYRVAFALPGASLYTYADVVRVTHDIPTEPKVIRAMAIKGISIDFECYPGMPGDRLYLDNAAVNPGFEQMNAGTAFSDTLANVNAYAVSTGGAPTATAAETYVDIILADAPLRYHRLGEASGTTSLDISGNAAAGTYTAAPTLGVTGALSGDTDTAATFNGSTQFMQSSNVSSLPTGTAAFSLECWVKFAANPSAIEVVVGLGNWVTNDGAYLGITSAGKAEFGTTGATTIDSASALSTGVWHHLVGTFAGGAAGAMTLYVDGVAQTPTTVTPALSYSNNVGVSVGSNQGNTHAFAGSVDEVCVYGAALSSTRVTAHYNAGHSGASGTISNAMQLASGSRVTFGSPAWNGYYSFSVRFRFVTGLTAHIYPHFVNGNNLLDVVISGTQLIIRQTIAGTANSLVTATILLAHEAWYEVFITQFPQPSGDPAQIQVALWYAAPASSNTTVANASSVLGVTVDAVTALSGAAALQAVGATLTIGNAPGDSTSTPILVETYGAAGWLLQSLGTGQASLGWDGATTYPSGPATSFHAARIDVPPAGTVDALLQNYNSTLAMPGPAAYAIPATQNQVLSLSAWVKSSGLASEALIRFTVTEYSSAGSQLSASTIAALSGNQSAWTQMTASYTVTQATTAYVDVALRLSDTVTPGASANGTIWFDNVLHWNTSLYSGQASMPYCENRFTQAPAQLLLSGLVGDLECPCQVAFGVYFGTYFGVGAPTFAFGDILTYALGRRSTPTANGVLVANANGWFDATRVSLSQPQSFCVLDASSYGGYYVEATIISSGWWWRPLPFSGRPADLLGAYHVFSRFQTQQSAGNLANIWTRALVFTQQNPFYGAANFSDVLAEYFGQYIFPVTASAKWLLIDGGQLSIPAGGQGALMDLTQNYTTPHQQWADTTVGGSLNQMNWEALLPVDSSLILGQVINASNGAYVPTNQWLWVYYDGLGPQIGDPFAWTYSVESGAAPNEAHSAGAAGTTTTGNISVNPAADPFLTLDPNQDVGTAAAQMGVNQIVAIVHDQSGSYGDVILPLHTVFSYVPLYLYPR